MYNTGAYSTRAQRSTQQGQGHLYSKGAFNTRSQYKDIEVSTADTGALLYVQNMGLLFSTRIQY